MLDSLQSVVQQYLHTIQEKTDDLAQLEKLRVRLLGKQGVITLRLKEIGQLPVNDRAKAGQFAQKARDDVQSALDQKKQKLEKLALIEALKADQQDVTLPGWGQSIGGIHPLTRTRLELEAIFFQAGFELKKGPEVEKDTINFTALNIPENHPARTLHDTFYLKSYASLLLRTHTSTVQIHALRTDHPPLRIISTGAVYRCDSDMTHTPMFHQLEGMVVDKDCSFSELKGLLTYFLHAFFKNKNLVTRFRTSYFPFTEPSAEVDIQCVLCEGTRCAFCSHTGWLEVLGCGMVHPNVLRHAGVSTEAYQGYAFGIGIERLTLLRYLIPDIRLLFENDSRLLNQLK